MTVSIPVLRLRRHCNPYARNPWGPGMFLRSHVRQALSEGRLQPIPGGSDHAGRVAFLVVNRAAEPIQLDVGVPALNFYAREMLVDGWHRLAAAIYSGHEFIQSQVSGQVDYATRLFGVTFDGEARDPKRPSAGR